MRSSAVAVLAFSAALLSASLLPVACGSSGAGTGAGTTTGTGGAVGTGGTTTTAGTGGLAPGKCRSMADCGSTDFCGIQILPPFCGTMCDATLGGGCQTDADCADAGTGLICDKPCVCEKGGAQPQPLCTKGCATAADCGPSMTCSATKRCVAATCAQPSDCTANFTCTAGQCAPKPCTKDTDCGNYCLDGSCSPLLGQCNAEVP